MQLRAYQNKIVNNTAELLGSGLQKVLVQLPTGGGKTICFASITQRYLARNTGRAVLILVHRKELLRQTRNTLWKAYGIESKAIVAGMKTIPQARVYVAMVESAHKRLDQIAPNIGLTIIDEAHLANFFKVHEKLQHTYLIGFTATPYSANKSKPLKNYFQEIISTVQISELIAQGHLAQNITYAPRDVVERAALSMKGGDFDEHSMGEAFRKPRYINNTVTAYEKYAPGTKAIIYNVTVEHSRDVERAFKLAGYQVRHVDGTTPATERDNIIKWFDTTPGAILCNVGVATTGTDIPSIETVIMNRATKSPILWLQCTGRGARPQTPHFTIIDLGGNALELGDWSDDRDWHRIFHNPPKKGRENEGVALVKFCPSCDGIIAAQSRVCKICGHEIPAPTPETEPELSDFVVITKGIDVDSIIEQTAHRKEYYSFFQIARQVADAAARGIKTMSDERAEFIIHQAMHHGEQWCKTKQKKFNAFHRDLLRRSVTENLAEAFKRWAKESALVAALPQPEAQPQPKVDIRPLQTLQPMQSL